MRNEVVELVERSLEEFRETYELEQFPGNMKLLVQPRDKVLAASHNLNVHSSKLSI